MRFAALCALDHPTDVSDWTEQPALRVISVREMLSSVVVAYVYVS